jgi:hypothetical protein
MLSFRTTASNLETSIFGVKNLVLGWATHQRRRGQQFSMHSMKTSLFQNGQIKFHFTSALLMMFLGSGSAPLTQFKIKKLCGKSSAAKCNSRMAWHGSAILPQPP